MMDVLEYLGRDALVAIAVTVDRRRSSKIFFHVFRNFICVEGIFQFQKCVLISLLGTV